MNAEANISTNITELPFMGKGEVRGHKFTLYIANPRAFIYQVDLGDSQHYEVFLRRINTQFGNIMYPSSKAFGLWAWSYYSLDKALEKFNSL